MTHALKRLKASIIEVIPQDGQWFCGKNGIMYQITDRSTHKELQDKTQVIGIGLANGKLLTHIFFSIHPKRPLRQIIALSLFAVGEVNPKNTMLSIRIMLEVKEVTKSNLKEYTQQVEQGKDIFWDNHPQSHQRILTTAYYDKKETSLILKRT